ncbi:MAG: nucleoside triphosphate pyrophosphohydrolase [Acidimicrobiia bacterium]|nr:nucleoside triphosphate pyrophosphohydrolase [Acidimicrobiia bacterium]NNC75737.1 nucleoside triphosphate pyrophosphohydrolase [Acidimicrobiia bacterium]
MTELVTVVGLGPAGLDRLPTDVRRLLTAPDVKVILRTSAHPAAAELLELRDDVVTGDDLYDAAADFEQVYGDLADRVLSQDGHVVYAVPGSAAVGERSVRELKNRVGSVPIEIVPGESFLELVFERSGVDPITDGVQVVDGRSLPDPLPFHVPTVVTQVDRPEVLADVAARLGQVLDSDFVVTVLDSLGSDDESVAAVSLAELPAQQCGPRTSLLVPAATVGWHGLVTTNRRLRQECPWDADQTHRSLLSHLIEETFEAAEAIDRLGTEAPGGEPEFGEYAVVEEELGDLLLQVVFHATLAREAGAFDVEEIAEGIRRKLVHRHPHVFGDVVADSAEVVLANWERIKAVEKQRSSLMDDVPIALPALARAEKLQRRAASVGFDWDEIGPVLAKVGEEVGELAAALNDVDAATHELGDVLFAVTNLARKLGIDAETALRIANERFSERFRYVETSAEAEGRSLEDMSLEEMDSLWDEAKSREAMTVRPGDATS